MAQRQSILVRGVLGLLCGAALGLAHAGAQVQAPTHGQNIQPAYEGWVQNADGTYSLFFGYMNRNGVEQPDVPVGPDNNFEPGPADRGQPTHFYPRRQQFVFKTTVPADWGDKKLIWTVTHNGRTDRAVGKITPLWMLDPGVWFANRVGNSAIGNREFATEQPPSIEVIGSAQLSTSVDKPVTLAVAVKDDGLPGPVDERGHLGAGGNRLRASNAQNRVLTDETGEAITGRPGPPTQDMVRVASAAKTGLAVTWLHYRGLGKVTFDPMIIPVPTGGGEATTTVRFSQPGTYVLRAVADDGMLTTPVNITFTVK